MARVFDREQAAMDRDAVPRGQIEVGRAQGGGHRVERPEAARELFVREVMRAS